MRAATLIGFEKAPLGIDAVPMHCRFVSDIICACSGSSSAAGADRATLYSWHGLDERGRALEIIALDRPDCVLAIHVMPDYRGRKS